MLTLFQERLYKTRYTTISLSRIQRLQILKIPTNVINTFAVRSPRRGVQIIQDKITRVSRKRSGNVREFDKRYTTHAHHDGLTVLDVASDALRQSTRYESADEDNGENTREHDEKVVSARGAAHGRSKIGE